MLLVYSSGKAYRAALFGNYMGTMAVEGPESVVAHNRRCGGVRGRDSAARGSATHRRCDKQGNNTPGMPFNIPTRGAARYRRLHMQADLRTRRDTFSKVR